MQHGTITLSGHILVRPGRVPGLATMTSVKVGMHVFGGAQCAQLTYYSRVEYVGGSPAKKDDDRGFSFLSFCASRPVLTI